MGPAPPRPVPLRTALLAAALCAAVATGSARATPGPTCDQAGAQAEVAMQVPAGLLRAIGRVESGRRDPATGGFAPWPWTINANGQGRFFENAMAAVSAVRALQATGTSSIDVGCFQVNLMHHPAAFGRLEDGFDPAANALYAATFLRALRLRLGSWEAAVGAYHSATAERGDAYRARVFAAWTGTPQAAIATERLRPPRPVGPVVIRLAGPDLAGPQAPMRVWTPSRPGTAAALIAMPGAVRPLPPPVESADAAAAGAQAEPCSPRGCTRDATRDDLRPDGVRAEEMRLEELRLAEAVLQDIAPLAASSGTDPAHLPLSGEVPELAPGELDPLAPEPVAAIAGHPASGEIEAP